MSGFDCSDLDPGLLPGVLEALDAAGIDCGLDGAPGPGDEGDG